MRRIIILLLLGVIITLNGCGTNTADNDSICVVSSEEDTDSVFQVSTINALLEGIYDGDITLQELNTKGNMGIGTYDALDGEMILIDNVFYKVRSDGTVQTPELTEKTPFAAVTFFEVDLEVLLEGSVNFSVLEENIDEELPTTNIPYAILITGNFSYVKTRAPPKQDKPYPPLAEALKDQPIFEFNDQPGTIVGFRLPEYVNGINVPGYHLHFITEDRTSGGHILEFTINDPVVNIDYSSGFEIELAGLENYGDLDLSEDKSEELEAVER
ncbi:acetolactate decarboxylase [Nanoarchaeota archaeon]